MGLRGGDAVIALVRCCRASGKQRSLGKDIFKSVYQTLVLGFLKCGSFKIAVKDETTVDAFRV